MSGVAKELLARPKEARVERDGRHGDVERAIEKRDAGLVVGWGARRTARAFGKDDDLAVLGDLLARAVGQRPERGGLSLPVDVDHSGLDRIRAEDRKVLDRLLHHDRRVRQKRDERKRLERRLMFRGDDATAMGNVLGPPDFDRHAGQRSVEEDADLCPGAHDAHAEALRHEQKHRQRRNQHHAGHDVEGDVEEERAKEDHDELACAVAGWAAGVATSRRASARRYFPYSRASRRSGCGSCHQASRRNSGFDTG